jgi:single-stranded DNA-binding protein
MQKEKFGIFAEKLMVKATSDVKSFDKMRKISASMGFKQKDGTWANEWLDLVIFDKDIDLEGVGKGDKLNVTGRLTLQEYTTKAGERKKAWSCFVDALEKAGESQPF